LATNDCPTRDCRQQLGKLGMGAFPRPEPMGKYLHLLMPALAMALLSRPAWAEELYGPVVPLAGNVGPVIEGEAFAVDGGTISIRLRPIRLHGVQTLEHDDPCGDGWTGGSEAMQFLSKLIAGQIVTCIVQGQDRNQRPVAVCSVGNTDINEAMVLNGVALSDTFSSKAYRRTEQAAQALGAGYHKSGRRCVPPWRRAKKYPS
jgi:endonuclease YncB( thermonuclease family)